MDLRVMNRIWENRWQRGIAFWVVVIVFFSIAIEAKTTPAYIQDYLNGILIPRVEFQNTPLHEALDILREQSVKLNIREVDPNKKGIDIVLYTGVSENKRADTLVTLKMENVSLGNALKRVAALSKMQYVIEPHAVLIVPPEWRAPKKDPEESIKTKSIIIPNFEFQNTPLSAAFSFLQQKSVELEYIEKNPAKKGIKIMIPPNLVKDVHNKKISLRLRNIPLGIALRYTAMQAGMQCEYEPGVVRIVQIANKKK